MAELINQAAKSLTDRLLPHLENRGFKVKKGFDGLSFKKREKFGFIQLSISFFHVQLDGGHGVFNPVISVRHDRVDNIVNQLGHIWGEGGQRNTTTVSRVLQFFPFVAGRDGPQLIRNAHLDADADIAAANVHSMLDQHGFSFFERYATLDECALGLNDPIVGHSHPLLNLMPLRAYYGVTAAALTRPDSVAGLVRDYVEYMRISGVVDPLGYTFGKREGGIDGIEKRLKKVAELALAAT